MQRSYRLNEDGDQLKTILSLNEDGDQLQLYDTEGVLFLFSYPYLLFYHLRKMVTYDAEGVIYFYILSFILVEP
jgi:hypothetical protein